MKNHIRSTPFVIALLGVVFLAPPALAARSMGTLSDPSCAVIEKADYDAEKNTITIRGRSKTGITLTVYDEAGRDAMITATRPDGGKWAVEFDIIGRTVLPGTVVVQGEGDCVVVRNVETGTLALLSARSASAFAD
jgi:hypothetical protein